MASRSKKISVVYVACILVYAEIYYNSFRASHASASPARERERENDGSPYRCISASASIPFGTVGNGNEDDNRTTAPRTRISFRLRNPKVAPFRDDFAAHYFCPAGEFVWEGVNRNRTAELPPSIGVGGVFDFTTEVSTDLHVLFLGDSVMIQIGQMFDGSVGVGADPERRSVLWKTRGGYHEGLTVAAPVRGGGVTASWRILALISKKIWGRAPANNPGGGWSDYEPRALLNHAYPVDESDDDASENGASASGGTTKAEPVLKHLASVGHIDAVVLRVPHGWMALSEITVPRILEAIQLCHEVLGARTVVIMTIPLNNNVNTVSDYMKVLKINQDIRFLARNWTAKDDGVRHVLVQDFGQYLDHVLWANARHLGYDVSSPVTMMPPHGTWDHTEGLRFIFDRIYAGNPKWPPMKAMVCASSPPPGEGSDCLRNSLSIDGTHHCMQTLGSRIAASVACLLGCAHNDRHRRGDAGEDNRGVRKCEEECNAQFMSVLPVHKAWVEGNVSMAAFAGEAGE